MSFGPLMSDWLQQQPREFFVVSICQLVCQWDMYLMPMGTMYKCPYAVIIIIIIIIIGTTAHCEPRPSSESSTSCPYSLQHSSSFSPTTSWHHPSRCPPILYKDKTLHVPILRSLDHFIGRRILDSPAIASLDFSKMLFSRAGCQPCIQPPAILENRLDCFLVWVFITDQSGMGGPTSS